MLYKLSQPIIWVFITVLFLGASCTNQQTPSEKEVIAEPPVQHTYKGREVSELAFLMRQLHDTLEALKPGLDTLGGTQLAKHFSKFPTAKPTSPSDTAGAFHAYAKDFMGQLHVFDMAKMARKKSYNNLIQSCENCHNVSCPGPLSLIKKLKH